MRLLISAAMAAALLTSPVSAQPSDEGAAPGLTNGASTARSQCPGLAPEPSLPNGASATAEEVSVAETVYQAWAEASRATIACLLAEYEEAVAVAQHRRDQHNEAADRLNTLTRAWVAEREEYCERPRTRCEPVGE